jgi:hypothetical protein
MDPVKGIVASNVKPFGREYLNAALRRRKVWIQPVVYVFIRVDICDWRLPGLRVCGHFDFVTVCIPMGTL